VKKVMRNEKVIAMIIAIVALLTSFVIPATSVDAKGPEIISVWPSMPPVIDGAASAQEWGDAASINLTYGRNTYGYMLVQNDASNLYLLIDLTLDIVENDPYKGVTSADYFELSFDLDQPGVINYPSIDFMYCPIPDKLVKQYYTGPFERWIPGEISHSQLGVGFGSSLNSQTAHRIWELAISLTEIDAVPGGLVRLGLRTHSDDPPFQYDQPENLHGDFSSHMEITLANRQVELLVLAHKDFCQALEPLKDHKEYTGMNTYIQSWQSLDESFYFDGDDEPERIKMGIATYERYCDTEYVMLVGDIDKFPARYRFVTFDNTPSWGVPGWGVTDLYYTDLYEHGTTAFDDWDDNRNGLYGEIVQWSSGGLVNEDDIDFLPEVAVGRVPASTVSEVTRYVNKVIRYELNTLPSDPWFRTAGLYTGNFTIQCNDFCSFRIRDSLTHQNFTFEESYWNFILDKPPANVTQEIINDMNTGVGFVNYCGHGWTDGSGWACVGLSSDTLSGLTNSDRLPIVFAAACDTGGYAYQAPWGPYQDVTYFAHCGADEGFGNATIEPCEYPYVDVPRPAPLQGNMVDGVFCSTTNKTYYFDRSCIAETFISGHHTGSPGSGAIAYLGGVSGMQPQALYLATYFFQAYDEGNCRVLGDMWKYMIEEYYDHYDLADSRNRLTFHQPQNLHLFGDPSLRVGGVGNVHLPDFPGTYHMVHDGWEGTLEGTLELITGSGDPTIGQFNVGGNYTSADGQLYRARGQVSTWDYPIEDWGPNHKIEFDIDFKDTPTYSADNQAFEGYVFTQTKDAMAGITWSQDEPNIPFGFYALKGGGVSAGASNASVSVSIQDFVGTYYMNHDGWEGTLELSVVPDATLGDQQPNLRGQYTSEEEDEEYNVRGYAGRFLAEGGPDHKIEFYIDLANTPQNNDDDLQFEGYLFTETKDAMAGIFWLNDTPFGFYAIKVVLPPISGCFVATAVYGTPMAEEIQILRDFRDKYLLTNPLGQALVDLYYKVSPRMAEFITEHPSLKPVVRAGLLPAVAMSAVAVNTSPAEKIAIVGSLVLASVAVAVWLTRRRGRGPEYTLG
jgi:hypothetical protein